MTAIGDPPSASGTALRERLHRGDKLLGALIDGSFLRDPALADLDFVVISGQVAAGATAALASGLLAVAVLVDDSREPVWPQGEFLTFARAGSAAAADVVLSDDGPARLVASPATARAAFASGAQVVVYDIQTMVDELLGTLSRGRPAVDDSPQREPLVLLSGMLGDARLWDGVAEGLSGVALPWPARIDLDDSVPEMALSVLAEAPPRFALAGHSLGAVVALEIMRRAPERVTRLALLNASARGPVERQLAAWQQWRRRTEDGEFDRVTTELANSTLPESSRTPTLLASNRRMAESVGPDGFLRQLAAQCTRPDSRASVAAIDVPVLVLAGELDDVCPPDLQRELVELCHGARLVTIANAGHMAPLEQPTAVTAVLREWLAGPAPSEAVSTQ